MNNQVPLGPNSPAGNLATSQADLREQRGIGDFGLWVARCRCSVTDDEGAFEPAVWLVDYVAKNSPLLRVRRNPRTDSRG